MNHVSNSKLYLDVVIHNVKYTTHFAYQLKQHKKYLSIIIKNHILSEFKT